MKLTLRLRTYSTHAVVMYTQEPTIASWRFIMKDYNANLTVEVVLELCLFETFNSMMGCDMQCHLK